jgi:cytochrome c oxidase assembly protein subunit 15
MLGRITVALFFLLLVWGNLVAGLKAGLACPDWPLCQGEVLPPFRFDIWMEFTHRLIAATATLVLVPLAIKRFKAYSGVAKAIPLAAFGLIAFEIAFGGLVVMLELPVQLTVVHFMTGLTVFLLVCYMAAFDGMEKPPRFSVRGYAGLFFAAVLLLYCQSSLGAYVRHAGAGLACPDFPTCLGSWLPGNLGGQVLIQLSHRLLALLIVGTIGALTAAAFLDERLRRHRTAAASLLGLGIIQIGAGAGVVQSGLNFAATALHLTVALIMLMLLGRMWALETVVEGETP